MLGKTEIELKFTLQAPQRMDYLELTRLSYKLLCIPAHPLLLSALWYSWHLTSQYF